MTIKDNKNMVSLSFRTPDRYAEPVTSKHQKKWSRIFDAFMEGRFDDLLEIHRLGSRGRIFAVLVQDLLAFLQIPNDPEPVFDHVSPNDWYLEFASKHDDIKIRTHDFYNPDYMLSDGTWLEITLLENTAYQKLFRYGHQAPQLKVLWLDEDKGLHKEVCQDVVFPNAEVISIRTYFPELEEVTGGHELIKKFLELKDLKGIIG